ncbi:2-C-methyl-D-erythritol 4-phosphate cytidylyltransferase [Erwinia sp. OLTSP20]|uniref:2-C-methyl-D-erythritol 4-phosphate cytidylyltransferase n=1 Tax=unclassified Erwinia TaxID=2622719 RepID=UPI000C17906E|nr:MULTISPECIES: 2-C-methyl-D-erythritol 4-phosphate cytidylyltransferase [unclassified Erwinia]PIJ50488.1 2-C-methyl-D-erythritol 4-phosphate cytidylyltransferase [Erwinia sp. OAMSP11]PIJ72582.1 2-C-methyl-D-erythritol 4-phosphate cytidylyltransferase [Erwinia sp. OLSSP12]PIJ82062.1 2-C-methyl-D-erythritol 4-phosphate cytidylyltransferase [Erwinia sp. OLCASP19]PIJ84945.1 2-C-methyl-D-erythritol 4-phosphate cytidylyltransferase [Erwinia sp. OLMTSP26]PIJ86549.1 2-C-methyl-D-erythritol 4-phospha
MNSADNSPDIIAVVPAAGIGSRMHCSSPKQYLSIGQQTIIEHTLAPLLAHARIGRVIVALSPDDLHFSTLPVSQHPRIMTVTGGQQRADSVLAGLQAASGARWALVHDAARPCLHPDDLARLLAITASSNVGGILAAPVRDTMKRAESGRQAIAHTVEREALWHALTPQLFPLALLRQCLQRALREGATITDEASALEYCGYHPELIAGRSDNIKVTRPEDLALASFFLSQLHTQENA